jgi:hypothetical protein
MNSSDAVFIAHSSKDSALAERICEAVEGRGIRCWISNRDVGPGENYQDAIYAAIQTAKFMILVFTENASQSEEIKKELALAGRTKTVIIPVRAERIEATGAFAYEMATRQWIDLFKDWDRAINAICGRIERSRADFSDVAPAEPPPKSLDGLSATDKSPETSSDVNLPFERKPPDGSTPLKNSAGSKPVFSSPRMDQPSKVEPDKPPPSVNADRGKLGSLLAELQKSTVRFSEQTPAESTPSPGQANRLFTKQANFPIKRAIAIGIVLIIAGAAILWGPSVVSFVNNMLKPSAIVEAPKDSTTPARISKTPDGVGQSSSNQVATVAQRVVLYDEDPADPKGKQYAGSVVWRTEQIKGSGNAPGDLAASADIDIPARKFKMTMSFRRNTDSSLPASHTAELKFILPQNFDGGGVSNVPGILMKSNEQARGTPLAGLAVKVTDGFFLVGLSNVDADRARNLQLLKERSWFDIPLVYANQRRAIIAIEKGLPGERAFQDAFAAWGE